MAGNWGAILAGLAGGADSLAQSMDRNEQRDERQKERAAAAMRQLAIDSLTRQKTLGEMGAVEDTGDLTQGDMASGLMGANLILPTGAGTADAGMASLAQALGGAKQEERGAQRFELPNFSGGVDKVRIDDQQTPEAKAMRRLTQQQQGQQRVEEFRTRAAEERNRATQKEIADRQDKQINAQIAASERMANRPQRVQIDDGKGGVKWAWLRPGEEAPVARPASGGRTTGGGVGGVEQVKSLGFARRMIAADKILRDLEEEGKPTIGVQAAKKIPLIGKQAGNLVSSDPQQRYDTARQEFGSAQLRKESGAAIPPSEWEQIYDRYIRVLFDKDANIEQKRAARVMAVKMMVRAAGPSWTEADQVAFNDYLKAIGEDATAPTPQAEPVAPQEPAGETWTDPKTGKTYSMRRP